MRCTGANFFTCFLAAALLLLGSAHAVAEDLSMDGPQESQKRDWSGRVGGLGIYKPQYEGSDKYEKKVFPLLEANWRDLVFLNARTGLGAYLWKGYGMKVGLSLGYNLGRDEDSSADLRGLGDIDGGATANVLFTGKLGAASFNARYEQQVTGTSTGFLVNLGLGYDWKMTETFSLMPSVRTSYASADYLEAYFSITPQQSTRSGMPVYHAGAGFKSAGGLLTAVYNFSPPWGIHVGAGYERLIGDAAGSPLVKDKDQYTAATGLFYRF